MNKPVMKLIQEVETCGTAPSSCSSAFSKSERQWELLLPLRTEVQPLSSVEYETVSSCLKVLGPFYQATVGLSEEKRVSRSKIIPMTKMLMRVNLIR